MPQKPSAILSIAAAVLNGRDELGLIGTVLQPAAKTTAVHDKAERFLQDSDAAVALAGFRIRSILQMTPSLETCLALEVNA